MNLVFWLWGPPQADSPLGAALSFECSGALICAHEAPLSTPETRSYTVVLLWAR